MMHMASNDVIGRARTGRIVQDLAMNMIVVLTLTGRTNVQSVRADQPRDDVTTRKPQRSLPADRSLVNH
jgi:hypothetical protein